MGRLLFPDAADAFGYQRATPNYERTRGMDAYGPEKLAHGIAAVQGGLALAEHVGSEYVKPLAQKVADWRMAARAKLGVPMVDQQGIKQSFGGLATAAYGPEGPPQVYDRSQMEPPLRQRKPIIAGGTPVARPGEVDLAPEGNVVAAETKQAPAAPQEQKPSAPSKVTQRSPSYPDQAAKDAESVLMREYMQLDEAAQNDTGENLPVISARMKAIQAQLQQMQPRQATPMEQIGQFARMNEAALGRIGQYQQTPEAQKLAKIEQQIAQGAKLSPKAEQQVQQLRDQVASQQPQSAAPQNKYSERLRQLDDQSLLQVGRDARMGNRVDLFDAVKAEMDFRADAQPQQAQQSTAPQNQFSDRLRQLDDASLLKVGRDARMGNRPDLYDAVKAEMDFRSENQSAQPAQATLAAAGRPATAQPQQQRLATAGQLAAPAGVGGAQGYAQTMGEKLQPFESQQQAPVYHQAQPEAQHKSPLVQNPNGGWQVYVDPKRGHSITELQTLINAAGRTGNVEDMQRVQQAIMSAPLDDAKPQSWMDIFSEIAGGQGSQRESTRQQLLQQLAAAMPKALSPMDSARLADIESKIAGRQQLEDVRVQQEAILREKAANEAERQRLDLENRHLGNLIKEYDAAAKKYGVNSARAKAALAEVKAAYGEKEIQGKLAYQQGMVRAATIQAGAAARTARAREFHETHDMQGRGDINIGGVKNLQKSLPEDWNKANDDRIKATKTAANEVPKFKDIVKAYVDYDAAVKANSSLNTKQRAALEAYYSARDRTHSYLNQMKLLPEKTFTDEQLKYWETQTNREDTPGGEKFGE